MINALHQAYRRIRYGKPVVVISGLPRSGTSMAMKMVEAGGLEVVQDGRRQADEDNPRGYYEDERVMGLAGAADKSWLNGARGKAVKVISYLLKELPPAHNYNVLFVCRPLDEVLASQAKMLARRGERIETSDAQMRELFETDLWRARYLMQHAPHFQCLELQYHDVLDNALAASERINIFLGGSLDTQKMAAVVDHSLYRNRLSSD